MSDIITQTRLAMRLDAYLREYTKNAGKDTFYQEGWNSVWQVADLARTNNTLTPEIVDDVRVALIDILPMPGRAGDSPHC